MSALAIVLVSFLSLPPADVCDTCSPKKLCDPHAAALDEALPAIKKALKAGAPAERLAALTQAAELNAAHVNAPSDDVTEVIASALEDDDQAVQTRAAELLRTGQSPEVAVKALVDACPQVAKVLGTVKATHPGADEAMAFAVAVVDSTASYRDDRCVEALGNLLERSATSIYGNAVVRIVDGLAVHASQDGIDALISYQAIAEEVGFFPKLEKHIHVRLTEVAATFELEDPPEWSEDGVSRACQKWFKKNKKKLPKKLGKAELVPTN